MDFKNILLDVGYSNIKDNGREFRMKPMYRDSSSDTVLSVRKDTGHFIDFSKQISGSFEHLIQLSLGLKTIDEAKIVLKDKWEINGEIKREHRPTVSGVKIFPKSYLEKIIPDHSYWEARGVSKDTLQLFNGGIVHNGTMANRYVFPIFNSKKELIGVTGRYTKDIPEGKPKWLHRGRTSEWKYPLQVNQKILKEKKEIILIESVGDMLSLWECGVKNTIVVFGLNISPAFLSLLIKLDPNKIFVSFNDDSDNNSAGNKGVKIAIKKLKNYFDPDQIQVAFPTRNDFGDMSREEILKWRETNILKK
jgi:5S rRNA maturation endonuclease (ribonuclease M5)